jgi:hypothetical protein
VAKKQIAVATELVEQRIYFISGQKVMLDGDLAELYQVPTGSLNQAVKRNLDRFPNDFVFQLTAEEAESLRSQIATSLRSQFVISNEGRGGRRYLPYAFTEHGVAMLSSVLNSKRAVQVNIVIIRTFIKLRQILSEHKDLAHRLESVERKYRVHDDELKAVFDAIRKLLTAPTPSRRRIGFAPDGR